MFEIVAATMLALEGALHSSNGKRWIARVGITSIKCTVRTQLHFKGIGLDICHLVLFLFNSFE